MKAQVCIDADGVSVEVDREEVAFVSAAEMERAGWEHDPACERDHCDDGDCPACQTCADAEEGAYAAAVESVTDWHNTEHAHALWFCEHPVCVAVGRLMAVRHD